MFPTSIGEGEKFSINTLARTINSIKNSGGTVYLATGDRDFLVL
jgi:hypothetical protein